MDMNALRLMRLLRSLAAREKRYAQYSTKEELFCCPAMHSLPEQLTIRKIEELLGARFQALFPEVGASTISTNGAK
jgi:hypothetical protein